MVGRMAGFSIKEALDNRKDLLNKNDYIDKNGKVDYKKAVKELSRISRKMTKECIWFERLKFNRKIYKDYDGFERIHKEMK